MNNWKEVKLRDCCSKIGSGATPRGGKDAYVDEGISLIRSQNVLDFSFSKDGLAFINEIQADQLKNVIVENDDVLINITGDSVARVCSVPKSIVPARVNQHVAILRPNKDILDNRYLKYYLLIPSVKSELLSLSSSGATRNALTKLMLEDFKIEVPDLPTQKTIAEILSSLDDKIELNNEMNKTLEELAQTLFKRWFVDFEFPDENGNPYKSSGGGMVESELGLIPKGWEIKSLTQIAKYLNGLALQKWPPIDGKPVLPVIKIKELRQGGVGNSDFASYDIPKDYIIKNGDIIFSWSGSLLIDIWCGGIGALNQHLFKVTSNDYPEWFIYFWTKHHLRYFQTVAESKATTMGHINRNHLDEALVLAPKESELMRLDQVLDPILKKIIGLKLQIKDLEQLRDTLLPKLMSGQIEVL